MRDSEDMDRTLYDAMGGDEAVLRLAHAWHERVLADEVVSHAFSHGFRDDHGPRLAAYWVEQLGGPAAYTGELGGSHAEVVWMHSGNGEHAEMDRRAEECFARALDDAAIPDDPELRASLVSWFHWGVGLMGEYHANADEVPDTLPMPHWSWDGPDLS
jgi:hemoglobin